MIPRAGKGSWGNFRGGPEVDSGLRILTKKGRERIQKKPQEAGRVGKKRSGVGFGGSFRTVGTWRFFGGDGET